MATKDKKVIPPPFKVIAQYESAFISIWKSNTAAATTEILKYLSKETAFAIKNGIEKSFDNEFEKAHDVGEIHSNGKWVWKEYKPGKFDWRAIKGNKPKKKINMWDIVPEIGELKTSKECVDYIVSEGVVTKWSDMDGCKLETAKEVCSALHNLKKAFSFDPITIFTSTDPPNNVTASASDGKIIQLNANYYRDFNKSKYYRRTVSGYKRRKLDEMKRLETLLTNEINSENPRKSVTDLLNENISDLAADIKKFPRWTMGEESSMAADVVIHEMGHILNAQCTGGCGHRFTKGANRSDEYLKKSKELNKERNELFGKYIKGDECISEYSTVKPAEFFAESFSAYVHNDPSLPSYVRKFMGKYFKNTTAKI